MINEQERIYFSMSFEGRFDIHHHIIVIVSRVSIKRELPLLIVTLLLTACSQFFKALTSLYSLDFNAGAFGASLSIVAVTFQIRCENVLLI